MHLLQAPDGDIARLCTFHRGFDNIEDPIVFRRSPSMIRTERVREVLDVIEDSPLFDNWENRSCFSIHQKNGTWIGTCFEDFREGLFNQAERYRSVEDYNLSTYKNESAIFIAPFANSQALVITAAPWQREDKFRSFGIRLVLDGYPLSNSKFRDFCENIEMDLRNGRRWEYEKTRISHQELRGVSVDRIDAVADAEGYVEEIVVENPLFRQSEFLDYYCGNMLNHPASSYRYVKAKCNRPHKIDETESYSVEGITLTNYNKIGSSMFDVENVGFRVVPCN